MTDQQLYTHNYKIAIATGLSHDKAVMYAQAAIKGIDVAHLRVIK